jgi:hypothetical protein
MAVVALLVVLASGASAEAGILGGIFSGSGKKKAKLPAASSPIFDRPTSLDYKAGNYQRHQKKFQDPTWGANWDRWLTVDRPHQLPHWAQDY